tara:strand:+ start:304 stop:540 length:237 start_codon:yes stop_codon:yes gene_type:complete
MSERKVIIYYNPEFDQLSLCWKSQKCSLTYEEVAKKDVPKGLKYKIVNESDLPSDLSFIDAWEDDFTDVTDTGEYVFS